MPGLLRYATGSLPVQGYAKQLRRCCGRRAMFLRSGRRRGNLGDATCKHLEFSNLVYCRRMNRKVMGEGRDEDCAN